MSNDRIYEKDFLTKARARFYPEGKVPDHPTVTGLAAEEAEVTRLGKESMEVDAEGRHARAVDLLRLLARVNKERGPEFASHLMICFSRVGNVNEVIRTCALIHADPNGDPDILRLLRAWKASLQPTGKPPR